MAGTYVCMHVWYMWWCDWFTWLCMRWGCHHWRLWCTSPQWNWHVRDWKLGDLGRGFARTRVGPSYHTPLVRRGEESHHTARKATWLASSPFDAWHGGALSWVPRIRRPWVCSAWARSRLGSLLSFLPQTSSPASRTLHSPFSPLSPPSDINTNTWYIISRRD